MHTTDQIQGSPPTNISGHDIVIIGGGPAGLTAAIYAARDKLSVLVVEKSIIGGLITETERVDNYPGFSEGISGYDIADKMHKQAQLYGARDVSGDVTAITQTDDGFLVRTADASYHARAVIVAGGSSHVKLGVPGEKEYTGRGVSYCATCDAPFFADKVVAIAGGGNTAMSEALHLTKFAQRVYIIHRREEFRATPIVMEAVTRNNKIEFIPDTVIEAVEGDDFVRKLRLRHVLSGDSSGLTINGLFVAIGLKPNTDYLKGLLELDAGGAIVVNDGMTTSVPGIFAAGDIRRHSVRQTVAAAGDGAVAALTAKKWLEDL